jgi:hypothetical protein
VTSSRQPGEPFKIFISARRQVESRDGRTFAVVAIDTTVA